MLFTLKYNKVVEGRNEQLLGLLGENQTIIIFLNTIVDFLTVRLVPPPLFPNYLIHFKK